MVALPSHEMDAVTIRDFAYDPQDDRFRGIYPAKHTSTDSGDVDESSDDEGGDWNCRTAPEQSLVTIVDTQVQPAIASIFTAIKSAKTYRAACVFTFKKQNDSEMSLRVNDQIIVLELDTAEQLGSDPAKKPVIAERWSSIDVLDDDLIPAVPLTFRTEPKESEFKSQVLAFVDLLKKYGSNWTVALKIEVHLAGSDSVIRLRDLGIVPLNYTEACVKNT